MARLLDWGGGVSGNNIGLNIEAGYKFYVLENLSLDSALSFNYTYPYLYKIKHQRQDAHLLNYHLNLGLSYTYYRNENTRFGIYAQIGLGATTERVRLYDYKQENADSAKSQALANAQISAEADLATKNANLTQATNTLETARAERSDSDLANRQTVLAMGGQHGCGGVSNCYVNFYTAGKNETWNITRARQEMAIRQSQIKAQAQATQEVATATQNATTAQQNATAHQVKVANTEYESNYNKTAFTLPVEVGLFFIFEESHELRIGARFTSMPASSIVGDQWGLVLGYRFIFGSNDE